MKKKKRKSVFSIVMKLHDECFYFVCLVLFFDGIGCYSHQWRSILTILMNKEVIIILYHHHHLSLSRQTRTRCSINNTKAFVINRFIEIFMVYYFTGIVLFNRIKDINICIDCDFTGSYSSLSCFRSSGKKKITTNKI